MIKDTVSHIGPAKPTIRKRPSSEHLEFFDNKLARSYPQSTNLKVDLTMQSFIHDHLKIDTNSSKNLVKESAEQTENRMSGGMMNWKANDKDCMRSKDEIEITSALRLSDEHHRHSDELNKVQLQVQEFVSSPRKESKPCHSDEESWETTLVERVLDGMVKPFSHESRLAISTSIRDSHLKPKAAENQESEIQLEVEVQGSSVPGEKNPAKNQDQREHLFSNVEVTKKKKVSATVVDKVDNWSKVSHPSREIVPNAFARRKLLILDINGLLADVVFPPPKECKGDINILRRAIFKRPFYYEFLKFCVERFDVGIWSSRSKKIVDRVVDYLLGDMKHKLLFCWDMSHCTETGFYTLENRHKPLVCKELRKIWEKDDTNLPWEKGQYDESNTMLLDDSPYKALFNPIHCAVFPSSFSYKDKNDTSLGPEGDLRLYVENMANAENLKKYVERHPFGKSRIDETSSCWDFYYKVLRTRSTVSTTSYLRTQSTVSTTSYLRGEFSNSVSSHGFVNDP